MHAEEDRQTEGERARASFADVMLNKLWKIQGNLKSETQRG